MAMCRLAVVIASLIQTGTCQADDGTTLLQGHMDQEREVKAKINPFTMITKLVGKNEADGAVEQAMEPASLLSEEAAEENKQADEVSADANVDKEQAIPAEPAALTAKEAKQTEHELSKPELVYNEMAGKVSELEKHIVEMQRQNEANMNAKATTFKKELEAQDAKNTAAAKENAILKDEIQKQNAENAENRRVAKVLEKENTDMRASLESSNEKLFRAREYATKSIEELSDAGASELDILKELDVVDAKDSTVKDHQNRLSEIASLGQGTGGPHLGMLDVTSVDGAGDHPGSLVQGLASNLAEFAKQTDLGENQLKAHFLEGFKAGSLRNVALMREQATLKETRNSAIALGERLKGAVGQLRKAHEYLNEQLRSVEYFAVNSHLKDVDKKA